MSSVKEHPGKFWAVGVGPGEPELVTVKAARLIASADVLYHAGPSDNQGFALDVVRSLLPPGLPVCGLAVPMVRGQDDWRERYRPAVERIAQDCRAGKQVVFIVEGDPTLYSSAGYVWQLLNERHPDIPIEVVPGVTSITAAAARAHLPLARKDESVALVPARHLPAPAETLRDFDSVVFLKLSDAWPALLDQIPADYQLLYAEKVGTPEEWLTRDREAMRERQPPYFSLLICSGIRQNSGLGSGKIGTLASSATTPKVGAGKLWVVGLGPGDPRHMTVAARDALHSADALLGYRGYLELLEPLHLSAERFPSELGEEPARAEQALDLARAGRRVALVSSGDPGVYGMASLVLDRAGGDVDIEIVPGVTAALSAAALLGAPLGHDFACISLSDLLTPWETIERRIEAAAAADFVIALYNPASRRRDWQLPRATEILLRHRAADTPVGIVDSGYRKEQRVGVTTLGDLAGLAVSMTTICVVGNSQTVVRGGRIITPRGYQDGR